MARTSSKEAMEVMDERDCWIFSRSERLFVGMAGWLVVDGDGD